MRRAAPSPVKASESVISRMLAKMVGVPAVETIQELHASMQEALEQQDGQVVNPLPMRELLRRAHGIYPWVASVASDIMLHPSSPLTEHLLAIPGELHVVKDREMSGSESLWLAVADPDADVMQAVQSMVCRGLLHTFRVGEELSTVIAIQLSSCQP
jgi:hypothetical protein